jgi:hypothetical protein
MDIESPEYWLRVGYGLGAPRKLKRLSRLPAPSPDQDPKQFDVPVVAHFGGGTNSTAYLIDWVQEGNRLDLVIFSDTGGEKPETYEHVGRFSWWLVQNGAPAVTIVRYHTKDGDPVRLEDRCIETKRLPSLAYGWKKCSQRFKRDPQVRFINNWEPARDAWLSGRRVIALIGYDADEPHRMARQKERENEIKQRLEEGLPVNDRAYADARKFLFRYPLLDIDFGREECVELCEEVLGYSPPKSSCFFCPASKPHEIKQLAQQHPDLLERALAIEANAESTQGHTPKLGRWRHWGEFIRNQFISETSLAPEIACECMD